MDEFKDQVSDTTHFNVGYYDGPQHCKLCLVTSDDLKSMYSKHPNGGELVLWCDGRSDAIKANKRKRTDVTREDKEAEVDEIYKNLQEKHSEVFDTPRLRLWARMIAADLYDNYDTPPNVPTFSGIMSKKPQKENMCEAITTAAVAFAKTIAEKPVNQSLTPVVPSFSPAKSIELRMKNYEQLRYLQQLLDDGIINENEFKERKESIICSLRKLNS